jgi:transcriptional regulator with XRE-family HTH domain
LHFPEYQSMVSRLIQERSRACLTQRALAARLSKPHSYVSKIESGERRIDLMELIRYLKAMDADVLSFVAYAMTIIDTQVQRT